MVLPAFVYQTDLCFANLTVREHLVFQVGPDEACKRVIHRAVLICAVNIHRPSIDSEVP